MASLTQDQNKENIHPNIHMNNQKIQFSQKLKKYPLQSSKCNNLKICQMEIPSVSSFEITELRQLSKPIEVKQVKNMRPKTRKASFLDNKMKQEKKWLKSLVEVSQKEKKLLERIEDMLQRQSFKPIYSSNCRNKYCPQTMATQQTVLTNSQYSEQISYNLSKEHISLSKDSNNYTTSASNQNKSISPQTKKNRTSTLSQLINLSRLSSISNKTLEKYLLCIEKEMGMNEMEKSRDKVVSEFNLLQTDRSKEMSDKRESLGSKENGKEQIQAKKQLKIRICGEDNIILNKGNYNADKESLHANDQLEKRIIKLYHRVIAQLNNSTIKINNPTLSEMLDTIQSFVIFTSQKNSKIIEQQLQNNF